MKLEILKDVVGNDYVGINIPSNQVSRYLSLMNGDFKPFNEKLLERNSGHYHITVFNVMECQANPNHLKRAGLKIEDNDVVMTGVGSIEIEKKGEIMKTFFIPIYSPFLNDLRSQLGLKEKDLHITIGFTHKDLFHARKNECNIINEVIEFEK